MTRAEALAQAEGLVERLSATSSSSRPDKADPPSLGDRISQILRVAEFLMKEDA